MGWRLESGLWSRARTGRYSSYLHHLVSIPQFLCWAEVISVQHCLLDFLTLLLWRETGGEESTRRNRVSIVTPLFSSEVSPTPGTDLPFRSLTTVLSSLHSSN